MWRYWKLGAAVRRRVWAALMIAMLVATTSCESLSGGDGGESIDQLHLLGTPVALELDKKPGADGVGVRVYASNSKAEGALRIVSGALELLLYQGTLRAADVKMATPLQIWTYPAAQLRQHEHKTAVGLSYNFVPAWDKAPSSRYVTLVARYVGPGGKAIYSAPFSVSLTKR